VKTSPKSAKIGKRRKKLANAKLNDLKEFPYFEEVRKLGVGLF
jgi:hypothetical protein